MEKITINLRDYTTLEDIIKNFNKINNIKEEYEINIVLYKYVLPESLCLIVSLYKYKKYHGYNLCVKISGENSYAERLDFHKQMDITNKENFNRLDSTGKFIEITKFNSDNNVDLVNSMMRIFRDNMDIDREVLKCMNYCLFEVVDNVDNHAKSPIDGYLAAQRYPNKGELRLIFSDCGIGIKKSLTEGKNKEYVGATEEEALNYCIKEFVTNGNGRGNGLYHTSRFIQCNGGTLTIYSGGKKIVVRDQEKYVADIPYFNGTIVTLLINMNNTVILEDIFGENLPTSVTEMDDCIDELW